MLHDSNGTTWHDSTVWETFSNSVHSLPVSPFFLTVSEINPSMTSSPSLGLCWGCEIVADFLPNISWMSFALHPHVALFLYHPLANLGRLDYLMNKYLTSAWILSASLDGKCPAGITTPVMDRSTTQALQLRLCKRVQQGQGPNRWPCYSIRTLTYICFQQNGMFLLTFLQWTTMKDL